MPSSVQTDEPPIPTPIEPADFGVVLFELPARRLPSILADLRRLGARSVSFRFLPTNDDYSGRALVRVESPPRLVVWRAMDEHIAYVEQGPGIWAQLGCRSQRVESSKPLDGNLMLLRANGDTEVIADGEYVSEVGELPLLEATSPAIAIRGIAEVPVRLRLVPGSTESPKLWVLREDALAQLTAYCRTSHQQLLTRYTVAVSSSTGVPRVVLRAITSRGPPPMFVGPAIAYSPALKLPNLYVPSGKRISPTMRRDALGSLLAPSSDRIVWLHPLDGQAFRPESIPESAFQPLTDWIDYRIADQPRRFDAWMQSRSWVFDSFVERRDPAKRPAERAATVETERQSPARSLLSRTLDWLKRARRERAIAQLPPEAEPSVPVDEAVKTALDQGHRLHLARPEIASAALERCRILEARFLNEMPSRDPDAQSEAWAELAAAYDSAANHADAALCWLNALWNQAKPNALWSWGWLRAEARSARSEVRAIDPIPWLAATPGPGSTRALAAWVVWASAQKPSSPVLLQRSADLHNRLESGEHWLPIRSAWLARTTLAQVAGADVLALARTRDRLSERLLTNGLSLELDTPTFLRFAGAGMRERFQEARRWLTEKRDLIHQWIASRASQRELASADENGLDVLRRVGIEPNIAQTRAYADLILAWGQTRFAEYTSADMLRKQAASSLPANDPVHAILRDAFEYRITQLREAWSPRGPLSAAILGRIHQVEGQGRYAIEKLREHSRILEPTSRINSFETEVRRQVENRPSSPSATIATLATDRLNDEILRILKQELDSKGRAQVANAFRATLDRAMELSEQAISAVFEKLPYALDSARDDAEYTRLLESALVAAARWDRADVARELAARFLRTLRVDSSADVIEVVIGPAVRALRKLGLKTDADNMLREVADRVLRGQPIGRLRATQPAAWPAALRVLLHCAAGWYSAGNDDDAHKILDEARLDLFAAQTPSSTRTKLALTYVKTLAQAPPRIALGRLEEMYQSLKDIDLKGSTNEYYSLNALLLIETTVRAVVSDDFAVGPQVRAWLDSDELSVRRRIREDLKAFMTTQGL